MDSIIKAHPTMRIFVDNKGRRLQERIKTSTGHEWVDIPVVVSQEKTEQSDVWVTTDTCASCCDYFFDTRTEVDWIE